MLARVLYAWVLACAFAQAAELKIVADAFESDDQKGISLFSGNVRITKGSDELNASKVTVHTDAARKPIRFVAEGNVSFVIVSENSSQYLGRAEKTVFMPDEKEYRFFGNVRLEQQDEKKVIVGDKVIVNLKTGRAIAEGAKAEPVIMIFEIDDPKEKK